MFEGRGSCRSTRVLSFTRCCSCVVVLHGGEWQKQMREKGRKFPYMQWPILHFKKGLSQSPQTLSGLPSLSSPMRRNTMAGVETELYT